MVNTHDTEKMAIELATAKGFLHAYNIITSFDIERHDDAPDFHCINKEGQRLFLEVRVFGDAQGTPAYILGRGPNPL